MRTRFVVGALALLLSGCLTAGVDPASSTVATTLNARPVVIAIIDSGVNPYLPIFRHDDLSTSGLPSAGTLELTSEGTYEARVAADRQTWGSVRPQTLYHFAGTRLLGITFDPDRPTDGVRDRRGHGTAVAEVAAREAPDAVLVAIQTRVAQDPVRCAGFTRCLLDPTMAEALEWAAAQEWIDIISVSRSPFGGTPDRSEIHPEMERWLQATESAVRSGKLVVNSAGNGAVPSLQSYAPGPPWVVSVGGAYPETRGESVSSAKGGVDIVSNMSFQATFPESMEEKYWTSGTSYAAPNVAGALAQALHLVRQQDPSHTATPREVRDALNATGIYFHASEWDPVPPQGRHGIVDDLIAWTNMPVLLQPQMGWGYVNGSFAPEIARRILENDLSIPQEKDQAILYQAQWQAAREEYWARWRAT